MIKNLIRELFYSGQFIVWKLVGSLRFKKNTDNDSDWQTVDWPNILVVQLNAIGDLIMTTPALNSLRDRFPEARIDALVRPHTKEILYNNPNINDIFVVERQPRQRKNFNLIASINTIRQLRKRRYELSIDFSGQFSTAWMSFFIGAKHRLGQRKKLKLGWFDIDSFDFLYTKELETGDDLHQVDKNLQLLGPLDCNQKDKGMELFPGSDDFDYIDKIFVQEKISTEDRLIVIHPGAKWPPKRWPEGSFAELVRRLSQAGCRVFLIGYGNEETAIVNRIIGDSNAISVNLVNKLTLLQTAALIKKSHLFIGNDSAFMHIAAAMNIPSILFFGPVSPITTAPKENKTTVFYKNTECSPCVLYFTKDKCRHVENICLKMITIDEVWKTFGTTATLLTNTPSPLGERAGVRGK